MTWAETEFDTPALLFEGLNVSHMRICMSMQEKMSRTHSKEQANSNNWRLEMGLPVLVERVSSVVQLHLPTAVIIQHTHTRHRSHVRLEIRLDWIRNKQTDELEEITGIKQTVSGVNGNNVMLILYIQSKVYKKKRSSWTELFFTWVAGVISCLRGVMWF